MVSYSTQMEIMPCRHLKMRLLFFCSFQVLDMLSGLAIVYFLRYTRVYAPVCACVTYNFNKIIL